MNNKFTVINPGHSKKTNWHDIENKFNHCFYAADTVTGLMFHKGCEEKEGLQITGLDDHSTASACYTLHTAVRDMKAEFDRLLDAHRLLSADSGEAS